MDRSVATSVTMKTGNKTFTPGKFENKWVGVYYAEGRLELGCRRGNAKIKVSNLKAALISQKVG